MTDKELMAMALFALDIVKIHYTQNRHINEAITALKEALAQEKALQALHNENERLGLYEDAYGQPEPVGYVYSESGVKSAAIQRNLPNGTPLYTAPPQRTEQEPDYWLGYGLQAHTEKPFENATALYKDPPQRTEQNFCPRCGKRTPDLITIHTCTPPK
jgi:hypothetical protein